MALCFARGKGPPLAMKELTGGHLRPSFQPTTWTEQYALNADIVPGKRFYFPVSGVRVLVFHDIMISQSKPIPHIYNNHWAPTIITGAKLLASGSHHA